MAAICLTCGCLAPTDSHGEKALLTFRDLKRAAAVSGQPVMEAAWNIPRTMAVATGAAWSWPPAEDPLTNRPVLVWDVDGVLAFTAEAICQALNARFGTAYTPHAQVFFPGTLLTHRLPDTQAVWAAGEMRQPAFIATIAPDFRALDVLKDACDAGFECVVATERDPALQDATRQWLHDWGAPPVEVHAVGHGSKPGWLTQRYGPGEPAVLVDDNPAVQLTVARPGISVWTPQRPYTPGMPRDHVRVFASWAQVRYWLGLGPQA